MKKYLSIFLACALTFVSFQADAARLGGGKSFGRQSSNVMQRRAPPPASPASPNNAAQQNANGAAKPAAAPNAPAGKRPWGGLIGGLAAGLGLAWLAHTLGLGEAFGNVLLVLLLAFVALAAWRFFAARANAGRRPGNLAFGGAGGPAAATAPHEYSPKNVGNDASARPWEQPNITDFSPTAASDAASNAAGYRSMIGSALPDPPPSWDIPADFDVDGFLGAAKRNFITLQNAWDNGDITALRSMMTDEMVEEIRTQLAERETHAGSQPNKTDVVMLNAKLLGIEKLADTYMASVEFSGIIREDDSAGPQPFREVWNMTKPINGGGGWLVGGVQALQ